MTTQTIIAAIVRADREIEHNIARFEDYLCARESIFGLIGVILVVGAWMLC